MYICSADELIESSLNSFDHIIDLLSKCEEQDGRIIEALTFTKLRKNSIEFENNRRKENDYAS